MKITIEGNTVDGSARSTLNVVLSGARGPAGEPSPLGVPYTGATQDVNLGEFGLLTGNVEFDTTPTNAPTAAGSMYYDDTSGTVVNILKGGNVISKIGETQHVRVYNNTGSNIAKGKVVAINGAQGQRPTIILADADSETLSKDTIGFTAEAIADGAEGFVLIAGMLTNVSTSGMLDGDTVYLSTTAGNYTNVKPDAPVHMVILGFVVNGGSGGAGQIYVKVDNGYELEELHNLKETPKTTAVDADALLLKDSEDSNLWKPFSWLNAKAGIKAHMDTFKGVAGGYASLDGSGKIPSTELPSYVDDVVEAASFAALPVTGETGKIYVTLDNNKCYRWSGSVYIQVSQGIDTLTTTGTGGAATLVGSTLNIPQYQSVLTNPVTGTGTAGQVAYFNGTSTVTGSQDFTWNDTTKILSFSNGGTLINEIRISSVNSNTMMGRLAGSSASLSGGFNSFFGSSAGRSNTSGGLNTFSGTNAGQNNTIGNSNSSFGVNSFGNNTTGSNNSSFGTSAGRRIADGSNLTIVNNGLFIGFDTRASADNSTNETVIGYSAIGLGSNTTVIGNSSTTLTWLGGSTSIGTTTNSARLHVRGSGTTSATTALLVQNSTPTDLFKVADDGLIRIQSSGYINTLTSAAVNQRNFEVSTTINPTSNTKIGFQSFVNFSPTSGTATLTYYNVGGTINQTGGANGITRGLYLNPTLTSAADWRGIESVAASNANHTLLKLRNATVDVFTVKADSKIGFFNATPVAQPTTGIAEAAFVENSGGTAVNVDSTFAGYTLQQIAQALKDIGLLA